MSLERIYSQCHPAEPGDYRSYLEEGRGSINVCRSSKYSRISRPKAKVLKGRKGRVIKGGDYSQLPFYTTIILPLHACTPKVSLLDQQILRSHFCFATAVTVCSACREVGYVETKAAGNSAQAMDLMIWMRDILSENSYMVPSLILILTLHSLTPPLPSPPSHSV